MIETCERCGYLTGSEWEGQFGVCYLCKCEETDDAITDVQAGFVKAIEDLHECNGRSSRKLGVNIIRDRRRLYLGGAV